MIKLILLFLIVVVTITTFAIYYIYTFDKKIINFIEEGKLHFTEKNERIKVFHFLLFLITNTLFIILLIRNASLSTFSLFWLFIVNILFLVVSWWINIKFPLVNVETNDDELKETEKTNNFIQHNINVTNINNSNTINSSHTNNHFEETNNVTNIENSSTINNSHINNQFENTNNNTTNSLLIDNSTTSNAIQINNVTNIVKKQSNIKKNTEKELKKEKSVKNNFSEEQLRKVYYFFIDNELLADYDLEFINFKDLFLKKQIRLKADVPTLRQLYNNLKIQKNIKFNNITNDFLIYFINSNDDQIYDYKQFTKDPKPTSGLNEEIRNLFKDF